MNFQDTPTGELFNVGAGYFSRVAFMAHEGLIDREPTIESVAAGMAVICDGAVSSLDGSASPLRRMMDGFAGPVAT